MAFPRIAVVIPALDEEEAIGTVVGEIPPLVRDVIVVDNGSRDRTAEVARAAGARVVSEPRRGYGRACLAGIAAAEGAEVLAFLDGDHADDPAQIEAVVAPILDGRADLVIGARAAGRPAAATHPWHAVLGTRACVALMNLLTGSRATDLGPFRAITAQALQRLGMRDRDYGWTAEMQVKAARLGLRVVEVPVDHRPRIGRSKVSGTVRGTVGAGTKIVWTILRHGLSPRARPAETVRGPSAAAEGSSPPRRGAPPWRGGLRLVGSGLVLTACVLWWAGQPPPPTRIGPHLASFGLAFAAYVAALAAPPSRRGLLLALAAGVLWRCVLVAAPPLLSDDVNRYVWEGRVQLHGGNPYAWKDRPESPRWLSLRDPVYEGLNHKDYTAVYPPLFLLAARAVVAIDGSLTAMKAFLAVCEVLTWGALALLLRRRRLPPGRLLVLAWSPLALLEIAGSGHNEAFAMLWLVLALLALDADRPLLSAIAASAGFLSKYLPGLVAAAWSRRYRVRHVLAGALLAAALFAFYLDSGSRETMLLSLSKYSQLWRFNETLFALLAAVLGSHGAAVRAGSLLTLALALALGRRRSEPVAAATAVVVASLLLAPNVLPWYALWLLPLLVLRDEPAALLFTGTVSLAYVVYPGWQSGAPWRIGWGWRALEYGPCVLVAAWTWVDGRDMKRMALGGGPETG
ncbi:MAG TPA: glycosyltransferase family 2 protein [Vicinamibacteria bacterium]|nr:glycosyltransferase family 2 protein [Vicinamibacteria bacterium]